MTIKCLSFDDYLEAGSRATMRCTTTDQVYEKWEKYHEALVAILETHGTVSGSSSESQDFYQTGDWFDTYVDGFSIFNTKVLSAYLLTKLRSCVASHDPGATIEFYGIEDPVDGLEVLVTSEGAFANWNGKSASECEEALRSLGVEL